MIGAARRHPAQLIQLFERALREDQALALRILLWSRDARGGAGERDTFRNVLHWLERKRPELARKLIASWIIPEVGRWDDVLGVATPELRALVASQVALVLAGSMEASPDRLAAKWMPRSGPVAAWLCKALGISEAQWRKGLAKISDTVEQQMSAGKWSGIRYTAVPSVAATRYQKAFARHDKRYATYIEDVTAGKATMHAGVVFPHDVVKASAVHDAAATAQWTQLPRPAIAGKALVLSDVSSSMIRRIGGNTLAIEVSIALGLLLSEALPEPFKNKVLMFSAQPEFHTVKGNTLHERVTNLTSGMWSMSTNIQAAFDKILSMAREAGAGFEMPEALIILSDMEFDEADAKGWTNFEVARRKFERAGFKMPLMVFWNLAGRAGNAPVRANTPGVVLLSGYSPRILDAVLAGNYEQLTPTILMRQAVYIARYDIPGLTIPTKLILT
ncbi:uncharacterized protein NMK_1934 [Novimethylophilus kurashikiensis]|uniref:Uncharacterized protein n=2 Tax=Novimethylophilus kurashikiensis TaxID=1825523 RepID=A0A2R5F8H9_9PROT|nr:uncharacterized protein NMK_1934 [Novimethylophilus kurashikiensis]